MKYVRAYNSAEKSPRPALGINKTPAKFWIAGFCLGCTLAHFWRHFGSLLEARGSDWATFWWFWDPWRRFWTSFSQLERPKEKKSRMLGGRDKTRHLWRLALGHIFKKKRNKS